MMRPTQLLKAIVIGFSPQISQHSRDFLFIHIIHSDYPVHTSGFLVLWFGCKNSRRRETSQEINQCSIKWIERFKAFEKVKSWILEKLYLFVKKKWNSWSYNSYARSDLVGFFDHRVSSRRDIHFVCNLYNRRSQVRCKVMLKLRQNIFIWDTCTFTLEMC